MEITLLGPVELSDERRALPAGTPRQRCVLAALAWTPGRPVSIEYLVDCVWGEGPPRYVRNVLYTYISRLRALLREADPSHTTVAIRRAGGGYQLDVEPDRVDLHRARRMVSEARSLAQEPAERLETAAELLTAAVSLWQERPLAGLSGAWVERSREALNQERLSVMVEMYRVELQLGRHAAALGALSDLAAAHPLDEPLAGMLMLALYRCGRQAEAIQTFLQVRHRLIDEIGDEPGPELRRLHEQILRREVEPPSAQRTAGAGSTPAVEDDRAAPAAGTVPPAQIPAPVRNFVGRDAQLRQLDEIRSERRAGVVPIVVLSGPAGAGKTALSEYWAHQAAAQFPDGQLHADLGGDRPGSPSSPFDVLARFLRGLGVAPDRIPTELAEAAGTFRTLTTGRQILVVLDNATDGEQVRPLLPGSGGMVIATSRSRLTGLVALDGAEPVSVGVLTPQESMALLTSVLGPDRVAVEAEAVVELAALCGHLPLALRIAGARLATRPQHPVGSYVTWLRDHDRLTALSTPGDERTAVRVTFETSYGPLPEEAQRTMRLLSEVPGPDFDARAVAALAGISPERASSVLDVLADAHLVEEGAGGRYRLHDLLRCYAAEKAGQAGDEAECSAAQQRLYDYYLRTAGAAAQVLFPHALLLPATAPAAAPDRLVGDRQSARRWFDTECANLVAAAVRASAEGPRLAAWLLADALRGYLYHGMHTAESHRVAEAAYTAADVAGDQHGKAMALLFRTDLHRQQGRYSSALADAEHARKLCAEAGWADGEGTALIRVGMVCWQYDRLDEALEHYAAALDCYRTSGWRHGRASTLINLAAAHLVRGNLARAADHAQQARAACAEIASRQGEAASLGNLAEARRRQGMLSAAEECFAAAHEVFADAGDVAGGANALRGLAVVHGELAQPARARELANTALAQAEAAGHPAIEADARNVLAHLDRRLGDLRRAEQGHRAGFQLARDISNRYLQAEALTGLADTQRYLGDLVAARVHATEALDIARDAGYRIVESEALTSLAATELAAGAFEQAVACCEAALRLHRDTGYRLGEARTLLVRGRAQELAGQAAAALGDRGCAEAILTELGVSVAEEVALACRGTSTVNMSQG